MTARGAILTAVAIAIVAAMIVWRPWQPDVARATTASAGTSAAEALDAASASATKPLPAAKPAAVSIARPNADQPLSLAYPALVALARGGDAAAMFDLGTRLKRCEDFDTRTARTFLSGRQEELDKLEQAGATDEKSRARAAALRDDVEMRVRTIAECEAVPEAERRSIAWIEAAARAGHHEARAVYLLDALDEFGIGAPDLIANIDEVIRRRDLARRFADEEVAACVPGAFEARMTAMDRTLGVLDPAQRLVAAHGALLEARDDDKRGIARTFVVEAAAQLDLAAREEARRMGEDAWRRCAGRR